MQAGHAIVGPQVDVGPAVLHQELCNLQLALLAGQIEWGGPKDHLLVHTSGDQQTATTG